MKSRRAQLATGIIAAERRLFDPTGQWHDEISAILQQSLGSLGVRSLAGGDQKPEVVGGVHTMQLDKLLMG